MTAVEIKRWFKKHFDIPVRVTTGSSKNPYQCVWIQRRQTERHTDPLVYDYAFPLEFGQACLRVIYPDHSSLQERWCGNVSSNSISMHIGQWEEVLRAWEEKQVSSF